MVLITIVTGANLNQLITGGPHIVGLLFAFIVGVRGRGHALMPHPHRSVPSSGLSALFVLNDKRESIITLW